MLLFGEVSASVVASCEEPALSFGVTPPVRPGLHPWSLHAGCQIARKKPCHLPDNLTPDDRNAMRQLATALAMQGRSKEAAALIDRAWGAGADPNFDRWASVYNTLGDEVMLHMNLDEAAGWYQKAARVAKRPIDVFNAHLGAGFVAALRRKGDLAANELEVAARVDGVSDSERDFVKELLGHLVKPMDGSAAVPEAAAALRRLATEGSKTSSDKSSSTEKGQNSAPKY
jgi:tetratricopeptide (TPR) repeat protein